MADVTDAALVEVEKKVRGGKKGLILGVALALALGGAGFYLVYSGLFDPAALLGGGGHQQAPTGEHGEAEGGEHGAASQGAASYSFVEMPPVVISLPPGSSARHLRFSGSIEAVPGQEAEVVAVMPRILDTLNTYLRAVEVSDLENPSALQRLRAQMLRRVQVVTGEGRVRDLLVTEFILN
jgi:flagellar protein FliL